MGELGILWTIVVGLLAGALASWIMKGEGFGFILNIIVGLIGSFVGSWVYNLLGISSGGGVLGSLITATVGAIILLFVLSLFNKRKR